MYFNQIQNKLKNKFPLRQNVRVKVKVNCEKKKFKIHHLPRFSCQNEGTIAEEVKVKFVCWRISLFSVFVYRKALSVFLSITIIEKSWRKFEIRISFSIPLTIPSEYNNKLLPKLKTSFCCGVACYLWLSHFTSIYPNFPMISIFSSSSNLSLFMITIIV